MAISGFDLFLIFDNLTFLSYLFSLVLFFLVMNRLFLRTLKTTRLPERNVIDVLNTLFFNPVLFKYDQNSPNALWFWDCYAGYVCRSFKNFIQEIRFSDNHPNLLNLFIFLSGVSFIVYSAAG